MQVINAPSQDGFYWVVENDDPKSFIVEAKNSRINGWSYYVTGDERSLQEFDYIKTLKFLSKPLVL